MCRQNVEWLNFDKLKNVDGFNSDDHNIDT